MHRNFSSHRMRRKITSWVSIFWQLTRASLSASSFPKPNMKKKKKKRKKKPLTIKCPYLPAPQKELLSAPPIRLLKVYREGQSPTPSRRLTAFLIRGRVLKMAPRAWTERGKAPATEGAGLRGLQVPGSSSRATCCHVRCVTACNGHAWHL